MYTQNPFEEISERLSKIENLLLDIRQPPKIEELPDRMDFESFLEFIGTKERPASKAQGYHLTSKKLVPFKKFRSKLIFSRKELTAWLEEHTLPPSSPEDELNANLVRSAQKHLRNGR